MKDRVIYLIFFCSIAVLAIFSGIIYSGWHWLQTPQLIPEAHRHYTVKPGASLYSVAYDLQQKDMIDWPRLWIMFGRFANNTSIKAGEFELQEYESPVTLLKKLNAGKVIQYSVTLVEGQRFTDYLTKLSAQEKLKTLNTSGDDKIAYNENILGALKQIGVSPEYPEGWFFPDTYRYSQGDTDISILKRAYQKMTRVLDEEWSNRAQGLPYSSPYEALVMASIVEKETGAAFERKTIAGVFVRRLQKKMRLQTDPTVIYGMGEKYQGNITRRDLKTATPYNTYVIKGLPPTPIAMPGREAIHAALHPEEGSSLYFVAKGDGTHQFSDTLEEHNAAVKKYQLKRRKDYRSSVKENK